LDGLPPLVRDQVAYYVRIAERGFRNGRVEATTKARETHWRNWKWYCQFVGLDPLLQRISHYKLTYAVLGFMGMLRVGEFGRVKQVRAATVSAALAAINKTISLATKAQPLKEVGANLFLFAISETLAGFAKEDPPIDKKLPVAVDVVEFLVKQGMGPEADQKVMATGDWCLIAFYFLLRIGEYTVKGKRNNTKQTVNFRVKDVTFFKKDIFGRLSQIARDDLESIMEADAVTLKLENQKNGRKGVCISHHSNGLKEFDPVQALGRRYVHIKQLDTNKDMFVSAYFDEEGVRHDLRDTDVRTALKAAATALNYPTTRNIPIDKIDTHSLHIGGANALALAGYSKQQIQKMGWWWGETFLEYVREGMAEYKVGMSEQMVKQFAFVSLEGGVYSDVTTAVVTEDDNLNVSGDAVEVW
jgi:hypothetical protein